MEEYRAGLEGYIIYLLMHFGIPEPWSKPEVDAFLDRMSVALDDKSLHAYTYVNRVWAQKPYDDDAPAATSAPAAASNAAAPSS